MTLTSPLTGARDWSAGLNEYVVPVPEGVQMSTDKQFADATAGATALPVVDRATIANAVRLLRLEAPIQDLLEEGRLTAGHGRALLSIADANVRMALARRVSRGGMTVRQLERLASRASKPRIGASSTSIDPNTKAALEELQREYATRVLMNPRRAGKPGQLIFEYYDDSDLTRLYDQLMRK